MNQTPKSIRQTQKPICWPDPQIHQPDCKDHEPHPKAHWPEPKSIGQTPKPTDQTPKSISQTPKTISQTPKAMGQNPKPVHGPDPKAHRLDPSIHGPDPNMHQPDPKSYKPAPKHTRLTLWGGRLCTPTAHSPIPQWGAHIPKATQLLHHSPTALKSERASERPHLSPPHSSPTSSLGRGSPCPPVQPMAVGMVQCCGTVGLSSSKPEVTHWSHPIQPSAAPSIGVHPPPPAPHPPAPASPIPKITALYRQPSAPH